MGAAAAADVAAGLALVTAILSVRACGFGRVRDADALHLRVGVPDLCVRVFGKGEQTQHVSSCLLVEQLLL